METRKQRAEEKEVGPHNVNYITRFYAINLMSSYVPHLLILLISFTQTLIQAELLGCYFKLSSAFTNGRNGAPSEDSWISGSSLYTQASWGFPGNIALPWPRTPSENAFSRRHQKIKGTQIQLGGVLVGRLQHHWRTGKYEWHKHKDIKSYLLLLFPVLLIRWTAQGERLKVGHERGSGDRDPLK